MESSVPSHRLGLWRRVISLAGTPQRYGTELSIPHATAAALELRHGPTASGLFTDSLVQLAVILYTYSSGQTLIAGLVDAHNFHLKVKRWPCVRDP